MKIDLSFHIMCDIKKNQDDQLTIIKDHLGIISHLEKENDDLYQKLKDYEKIIVYLEKDNNRLLKELEPLHRKKVAQIFWKEYRNNQK